MIKRGFTVFLVLFTLLFAGCREADPDAPPADQFIGFPQPEPAQEIPAPPPPPAADLEAEPPAPLFVPSWPAITHRNYLLEGGRFELPAVGATAFAAVRLNMRAAPDLESDLLYTMDAGQPFVILEEDGEWWRIEFFHGGGWPMAGWVMKRFTMINLPDIIPSIVFNNTNTFFSLFKTSRIEIPNVTGLALYDGWDFNERFERYEFIMPVLYATAARVMAAQQAALASGRTLVIYEAFRPHCAHGVVYDNFVDLFNISPFVQSRIVTEGYTFIRFLAASPYNHQRGTAVDVTLARIFDYEIRVTGNFSFMHVTQYLEYEMQSPMHELSIDSAIFVDPVVSHSTDAWRAGVLRDNVTEGTRLLLQYMTGAGFSPLSAEWWHFNDIPATDDAIWMGSIGQFVIERTYSRPPW